MEVGHAKKEMLRNFVDEVFSWSVHDILDDMKKNADGARTMTNEPYCRVGKLYGPFCFINVTEGREEVDDDSSGSRNLVEVALVIKIVQRLYEEWRCCAQTLHVAVISPYSAQVVEIERRLEKTHGYFTNFVVKVKTFDGFRDGEADVIIVSTVKANCTESAEFNAVCHETSSLFTKARHCLWILGSGYVLCKANPLWESMISKAKERKWFLNANEDEEMSQIITNVKSQLDELEDLLDMKSLIFKDARWKVMFSEMFVNSFSKLPSKYSKKIVLNFLLKLANGWRPKKYKADAYGGGSISIAKQYEVQSRYIICTNDISVELGYATQVMKVWDILFLVDVPTLVNKLESIYRTFSDDYLRRCKEKCLEGILEVPRRYNSIMVSRYRDICDADSKDALYGTCYIESGNVKDSLLLMKFYSFSAGVVSHLLSARDGTPINVPFEVTDQEREIILHQKSSFVVGRSGTGKTTVLVMKLFQKEQILHLASKGFSETNSSAFSSSLPGFETCTTRASLRQLFVTVNLKLCIAVKRHISNFQRFVRGETFGEEMITVDLNAMDDYDNFKDVPTSFVETPLNVYPLVVTLNMFLLMLDRTVGTSFFDRFPDIRKVYSEETQSSSLVYQKLVKRREVEYDKFREAYWSHFNAKFTSKMDPSRVFTEINTHIKGCQHRQSSMDSYIQLSERKGSTFSEEERERIYRIYMAYEKMKMARGEFDLADLVDDLHRRLKQEQYGGDYMDFVYVDEVQDLTMKQITLLKYICKNVDEGFVFAGDTAQTIARGVDFRFEDIRCLFFTEFLHGGQVAEDKRLHNSKLSRLFHLSQNFRTHSGILNLAQSITELVYHFFPQSIDRLNPETSLLSGEAPVLLDCGSHGDALSLIFQNKGNDGENLVSFGSEQVILVRDDHVKKEITRRIERRAIVLTIFECKGLEFQDVLVYNFFGTSPLQDQWRVVYEYMNKNGLCPENQEHVPTFCHSQHNIMCYELKQLYVAVTRTKQRLWIVEDTGGFSSPVVRYWQKLNNIQVKKLDYSYAQEMPVISSSKDWKFQGIKMLEVRNYKIAAQCFTRAGEFDWKTFAKASELKEAAQNSWSLRQDEAVKMLEEAAELFKSISNPKKAAECYFDAEYYEKAGSIYYTESDIQRAGQCFTLARSFKKAAEIYAEANLLKECLDACSKGKLYVLGLQYVRRWQVDLKDLVIATGMDLIAIERKFLEKCAFASYKQQDKDGMMKYVKEFSSLKLMQSFLTKLDCIDELLELLVDFGEYVGAARVARQMGNILLEADLLQKGHCYQKASLLYLASVLAGSLWAADGGGWPLKEFPSKTELSLKAKASAGKYMPHFHRTVCLNIQLLSHENFTYSDLQQKFQLSRQNRNLRGEILAARKLLDLLVPDCCFSVKFRNKVPLTKLSKLFEIWNFWKDNVVKILSYLSSLKAKGPTEYIEHGDFCLEYLGVRKRTDDPEGGYFLLYDDAKWVSSLQRKYDKKDSLSIWQLVNAGEKYWCSELLTVGMKVLEMLESVRKLGVRNSMPMYYDKLVLLQIFEVAASLLTHCRYLKETSFELRSLISYADLSVEEYFASVFSLDKKTSITNDSMAQTVCSRNILKEAIFRRFNSLIVFGAESEIKRPTLAQLIQVVVVLLGSGRQVTKHQKEVVTKFDESGRQLTEHHKEIVTKFEIGSTWRTLLDNLVEGKGKVPQLHDVLSHIYKSKAEGYHLIPPSCFVYLLDRLLLMVSCFGGYLLTTRSSVIEWLIHLNWNVNPTTILQGCDETPFLVTSTYDFIANTAHEILVNRWDMEEWIDKTGFDLENSFQPMTLKLVLMLIFVYLNTGRHLELLNDVLRRSDIIAPLPTEFKEVFFDQNGGGFHKVIEEALLTKFPGELFEDSGSIFHKAVAEALKRIDDRLVVIRNAKRVSEMNIRHAVFLNVLHLRNKDDILEKLRGKALTRQT